MSGSYRKAYDRVLPHALQVADPFGVIRLANQRLDDLRRRVPNETLGHRGRKDDPLYRIRRLLTAAHERISDRGQTRLRGLLDAGDPHGEVRTAWHATETVRGIYGIESPVLALRYTLQLADDLQDESCPPEINKLGRTIARWTPQITNWHISKVTNRRHRSPQQPNQTDQTSSVRVTQLRELPNTGPSLRRETQLGPTRDRHSPLKRDEPVNLPPPRRRTALYWPAPPTPSRGNCQPCALRETGVVVAVYRGRTGFSPTLEPRSPIFCQRNFSQVTEDSQHSVLLRTVEPV